MPGRRILLLGRGELTDETEVALRDADADVERLEDPGLDELRDALEDGADVAVVVSRDPVWPLKAALHVRHIEAEIPIVATIFDHGVAHELEELIGNCQIASLADSAAPALAEECMKDMPEVRPRRARALLTAVVRPFDRSAGLLFFGAIGLLAILTFETVSAAIVLEQNAVDAFYGAVKTLVTVDPNQAVQHGPSWFKVTMSLSMMVALLFAAAFTGGLVERLIGRRLTGLWGSNAVPRSDHVVVVGLGQVGLRLALLLRRHGISVVAIDESEEAETVGHAKELGLPVVIGRGADPSLLRRLGLERALALAAVTGDGGTNIAVALSGRALAHDLRLVLRAGGETRPLEPLGAVVDVNGIAGRHLAELALGAKMRSRDDGRASQSLAPRGAGQRM